MALLDILVYPDPRLRRKALPVESVDDEIRLLIRDMAETMYQAPGIGLAATQVNVSKRVMVIDHSDDRNELQVFINPVIRSHRGETETEEGCLSVPGIVAPIKRAEEITVTALDSEGQHNEYTASGILAICLQHELDHLDGKVFVDYLSRLKRERIRKQLLKDSRNNDSTTATNRAVAL
jgi:peptide deformylase